MRMMMFLVVIMITTGSRHRSATRAYLHWVTATPRLLGMPFSTVSNWRISGQILTACVLVHVLSFWGRVNA